MAAAYAALVSLFNNLELMHSHPARFSLYFDQHQLRPLGEHIHFFLHFVETYNTDGGLRAQELRRRIASAAHEAEDIIESHIANLILPQSAETNDVRLHHRCLFGLQKVIQDMDSIKNQVILKMKEENRVNYQKPPNSTTAAASSSTTEQNRMMEGFEDELSQLKDVAIGQQSSRQIISIVGMGGAGKTTLAKCFYEESLTMHHFDLRAWATISQHHDLRNILLQLLSVSEGTVDELGEQLHKKLFGRRYLIVLDDVWSVEVWDKIKFYFPDNGDGSRIILTTRLSNMATQLHSICIRINFLDEDKSWNLFCQEVFGQKDCPVELVGIGKKIVEQCEGLPLYIVVIGGLLKKSPRTEECWQSISKNTDAIFTSKEYKQCLDVLYLSYSHLPAHLKPCFLYVGIFKEDANIRVSKIVKLWVGEGFLKPNGVQILEDMAEDYLKDLIDRNLILVCGHGSNGRINSFYIHDVLRELCISVADREEFFCVARASNVPQGIDRKRRLIFHHDEEDFVAFESPLLAREAVEGFQSKPLARTLIADSLSEKLLHRCRLVRVLEEDWGTSLEGASIIQNVNLRYVCCPNSKLSINVNLNNELEIWKMTQLRHLKGFSSFPDPPPSDDKDDSVVLGKFQTLKVAYRFRLSEEVCKRIRNIKKLSVFYFDDSLSDDLQNLTRLKRLESISIQYLQCDIPISKLKNVLWILINN